jgi:Tol biopolymer transport system component
VSFGGDRQSGTRARIRAPLRVSLVLAALGALAVAAGAFGTSAGPDLLFVSVDDTGTDELRYIEVVHADGTGRRKLTRGESASWAPDGSRIAFAAYREDTRSRDLFVRRADGSQQTRLTRTPEDESSADWSPDGQLLAFTGDSDRPLEVRVVAPDGTGARTISPGAHLSWSPDGSRLASVRGAEIWVTRLDGSSRVSVARLQEEVQGQPNEWPVWSPDSSRLAYIFDGDLWVVPAAGGIPRALTSTKDDREQQVSWSPDGTTIAFVRRPKNPNGLPTLWVADPARGTTRRLGDVGAVDPVWTPDGRTIVFVRGGVDNCNYKGGCDLEGSSIQEGSEPDNGIYAIGADGTGQRRLTRGYDVGPVVSPAGSHLVFPRSEEGGYVDGVRLVGLSGGCTRRVAKTSAAESISWNPKTPRLPRIHCVDLTLSVSRSAVSGLGKPFTIEYVVGNTGDQAANGVRLTVGFPGIFRPRSAARCQVVKRDARWAKVECRLGAIRPGSRVRVAVEGVVAPPRRSDAKQESTSIEEYVSAEVAARGDDSDSLNNTAGVPLRISRCTFTGTLEDDRLTGTAGADYICGRLGNDRLRGLSGNDALDGGLGADTLDPGPGRDIVRARGGDDVVLAADGETDIVACGSGEDRVVADKRDRVDGSCERVERRP